MEISYIAHAYWRQIKAGNRTFESVKDKDDMKKQVRYLAQTDVANGVVTAEEYLNLIGEVYVPIEE